MKVKWTPVAILAGALAATAQTGSQSDVVELTAQIAAIDHDARVVTLVDDTGNVESIYAGPDIKRFSELKVGDSVTFRYYESLVSRIRKASDAAPAKSPGGAPTIVRGTGARPSGTLSQELSATVTVKTIDLEASSLTVTLEDGRTMSFKVTERKLIEGIEVGDKIDVTYTAAVTITVH